uniref:Putative this conserved domain family includes a large number n=1 Tax=Corethrella appendiculata TaxID=1370023 RepID=U5ER78_9DIPT
MMNKFAICLLIYVILYQVNCENVPEKKRLYCEYLDNGSNSKQQLENIPIDLCTHLIFSKIFSVGIESTDTFVLSVKPNFNFQSSKLLHKKYPKTKFILSIEWDSEEISNLYSTMPASRNGRRSFIKSLTSFMQQNLFDGVQVMWNNVPEKDIYLRFISELRFSLDKINSNWEIIVNMADITKIYVEEICGLVDGIFIDSIKSDRNLTSCSNPLYGETGFNSTFNELVGMECPTDKIIFPINLNSVWYTLEDSKFNSVDTEIAINQNLTKSVQFNEICAFINDSTWQQKTDASNKCSYMIKETNWITYEGDYGIDEKIKFVCANNVNGLYIHDITKDDAEGKCGENYSRLKMIHKKYLENFEEKMHNFSVQLDQEPQLKIFCTFAVDIEGTSTKNYSVGYIPLDLCTHVVFSELIIEEQSFEIYIPEKEKAFTKVLEDKSIITKTNPRVKQFFQIFWRHTTMLDSYENRKKFIENVAKFMSKFHFDGVVLNYRFPNRKDEFLQLLLEMRFAFKKANPLWEIIMYGDVINEIIEVGYYIEDMCNIIDHLFLQGYVFASDTTACVNQLHEIPEKKFLNYFSTEKTLSRWTDQNCPSSKIVVTINLYGLGFLLQDSKNNKVGDAVTTGEVDFETGFSPGSLTRKDVCSYLKSPEWQQDYDELGVCPYMYNNRSWVTYETQQSLRTKMDFVKEKLAGVVVNDISDDDFIGDVCGQAYPLLNIINGKMPEKFSFAINRLK